MKTLYKWGMLGGVLLVFLSFISLVLVQHPLLNVFILVLMLLELLLFWGIIRGTW